MKCSSPSCSACPCSGSPSMQWTSLKHHEEKAFLLTQMMLFVVAGPLYTYRGGIHPRFCSYRIPAHVEEGSIPDLLFSKDPHQQLPSSHPKPGDHEDGTSQSSTAYPIMLLTSFFSLCPSLYNLVVNKCLDKISAN